MTLKTVDHKTGHFFCGFGRQLTLREVIVGARSELSKAEVQKALSPKDAHATIEKARLAFKTFKIVRQRDAHVWHS